MFQSLQNRRKDLKQIHADDFETLSELKKENSIMKEKKLVLEKDKYALKRKSKNIENEILLEALIDSEVVIKKYDTAFKQLIA